jgi:hypothetical protein
VCSNKNCVQARHTMQFALHDNELHSNHALTVPWVDSCVFTFLKKEYFYQQFFFNSLASELNIKNYADFHFLSTYKSLKKENDFIACLTYCLFTLTFLPKGVKVVKSVWQEEVYSPQRMVKSFLPLNCGKYHRWDRTAPEQYETSTSVYYICFKKQVGLGRATSSRYSKETCGYRKCSKAWYWFLLLTSLSYAEQSLLRCHYKFLFYLILHLHYHTVQISIMLSPWLRDYFIKINKKMYRNEWLCNAKATSV